MDKKRERDDWILCPSKMRKTVGDEQGLKIKKPLFPIDAYSKHKMLVNEYLLSYKGATKKLKRDTNGDKTDSDVLKDNHKFLWDEEEPADTWEKRVAKKYYDKLFKEYCISDLRRYKENKIALRWRTENEVVEGKGQFSCADLKCNSKEGLKSWEVNFAYIEQGQKKNALVKIRLCPDCSYKLNYHHKRKEAKKAEKDRQAEAKVKQEKDPSNSIPSTSIDQQSPVDFTQVEIKQEKSDEVDKIWRSNQVNINFDSESIESEMDQYLAELFM